MKSKLLEYWSVNIHDATTEINLKKSLYTYTYFHSPVSFALKLGGVGESCCFFSLGVITWEKYPPLLPSMCPHAS